MKDRTSLVQQIQEHLTQALQAKDTQAQAIVKRTSLGWLKLRVVTSIFEGKSEDEREEEIDNFMQQIDRHLNQYPMGGYDLLTPQEAIEQPREYIQLPLWSEILMAYEPDQPAPLDDDSPKRPLVVTFYSFKGGVGRSTALGIVAGILASRNRRVVMIDFDLESPGISIVFRSDIEKNSNEQYGVVDYLHQRYLTPDENIPNIESCISKINLQNRGELFMISAGEYDENYIHRLGDLDIRYFYKSGNNAVEQLMADIKTQLDPDVILIDACSGFNNTGAIALLALADTAILCFSPTDPNFEGLRWVVKAIRKQNEYQGKPDIRFLLTPMPPVAAEQRQVWLTRVEDWIEENWSLSSGTTVGELYYTVSYNPEIATLSSLVNDVPKSLLDAYLPIADAIDASLSDIKPSIETSSIGLAR